MARKKLEFKAKSYPFLSISEAGYDFDISPSDSHVNLDVIFKLDKIKTFDDLKELYNQLKDAFDDWFDTTNKSINYYLKTNQIEDKGILVDLLAINIHKDDIEYNKGIVTCSSMLMIMKYIAEINQEFVWTEKQESILGIMRIVFQEENDINKVLEMVTGKVIYDVFA